MTKEILERITRDLLKTRLKTRDDLDCFKRKMAKKYKVSCPKNVDLLKTYHKLLNNKRLVRLVKPSPLPFLEHILRKRPVRSLSGIVNVSVLTSPRPPWGRGKALSCPGKCLFCPTQKGVPKSYLAKEPAVQRAILNKYNPYLQVKTRLESLSATGHPIDKVELRVIGGTWSYYPAAYQTGFIKECLRACNEFYRGQSPVKLQGTVPCTLKSQQQKNEKVKCRIVGLSIETRPDYVDIKEIKGLRELGVTKVELGAQSIYDDVLKLNKRGHGVKATVQATKLLKNAGFKVSYQMMPNLPGSSFKKDVAMFKELFTNPNFKPDSLKIYPLALVKNAALYKWYKQGKYKPYPEKQLIKLLLEIKKHIPYWCRVERIIRDIPSTDVLEGGAQISNLREVVQKKMREQGVKCKCIRCREVAGSYNPKEKLYLFRQNYTASDGLEVFLCLENKTRSRLYALLRLRLADQAIIREAHTYGQMAQIVSVPHPDNSPQHKGLGKKLIKEAEKIAEQEFGAKKIAVIASVGTREYYRKLGYKLKDTYMLKKLQQKTPNKNLGLCMRDEK